MKKLRLLPLSCAWLLGLLSLCAHPLSAQVLFFEDFQNGIPADFTILDEDGRTPVLEDLFTDAWVTDTDLDDESDLIAISTSFYSPPGQADDWMILPAITIPSEDMAVSWRARARDANFPDGYEVRVSVTDSLPGSFTDVLLEVDEASNTWTRELSSLANYVGQRIFIAFRNNSLDQFILEIDDIEVAPPAQFDVEITATAPLDPAYTIIPLAQVNDPLQFEVEVTNQGIEPVDSVTAEVLVFDETFSTLFFSDNLGGAVDQLAPGEQAVFSGTASFVPPDTGVYLAAYLVETRQADEDTTDNFELEGIFISDSVYARNNLNLNNILGIGDGGGSILGHTFELHTIDTLTSISTLFVDPVVGGSVQAVVHSMANEIPGPVIYESEPYTFTEADNPRPDGPNDPFDFAPIDFAFPSEPEVALIPAGTYFFGLKEVDSAMNVAGASELYTPGVSFIFINQQGTWLRAESSSAYGPGYNSALYIRPNFADQMVVSLQDERALGLDQLSVFPNPGLERVWVKLKWKQPRMATLSLWDLQGRKLLEHTLEAAPEMNHSFSVSELTPGLYILRLQTSQGSSSRRLMIR